MTMRNQSGFSTILALLLTGFLVTLAAGVLFLFLSENRINQSLLTGTAAYHAAEGGIEYALLKIKNHREGFADTLVFGGTSWEDVTNYEGNRIGEGRWPKAPRMGYEIVSGGSSYTGSIAAGEFAVIPLFREKWAVIATQWARDLKNPKKPAGAFDSYAGLTGITAQIVSGEGLTWNIIGNIPSGDSFGISGKLVSSLSSTSLPISVGCIASSCAPPTTTLGTTTEWDFREYSNGVLSQSKKDIGTFLSNYQENYLILYNAKTSTVSYAVTAPTGQEFTFPATRIKATGKVRDSLVGLELSEAKSSVYDILKYSLFVK
jgi:hypothetical protein